MQPPGRHPRAVGPPRQGGGRTRLCCQAEVSADAAGRGRGLVGRQPGRGRPAFSNEGTETGCRVPGCEGTTRSPWGWGSGLPGPRPTPGTLLPQRTGQRPWRVDKCRRKVPPERTCPIPVAGHQALQACGVVSTDSQPGPHGPSTRAGWASMDVRCRQGGKGAGRGGAGTQTSCVALGKAPISLCLGLAPPCLLLQRLAAPQAAGAGGTPSPQ